MPSVPLKHLRLVGDPPKAESLAGPRQPTLDDSELLSALRAGDPGAAAALHDRARRIVSRTVSRLVGNRDSEAEDIAQLAFIELVSTIERFRGDCPLDAWVSVVTARVVYKRIRRRRLERKLFSAIPAEALVFPSETTRREVMVRDAVQRVRSHLTLVDANRSWTFLLHDVYGYDLREVASITGVSVAAAQSRLVRGRREVHERINADPELAGVVSDLCETEGGS